MSHRCRVSRTRRADKKEPLKKSRSPAAVRSLTLTWYIICTTMTRYGDRKRDEGHTHTPTIAKRWRESHTHTRRPRREGRGTSPQPGTSGGAHYRGTTAAPSVLPPPASRVRDRGLVRAWG